MKKISFILFNKTGKGGTISVLLSVLNHIQDNFKINLVLFGKMFDSEWISELQKDVSVYYNQKSSGSISKLCFCIKYLIFTDDDTVICMSSKAVKVAFFIKLIFRKKYKIYSWIHFSLHTSHISIKDLKCADFHLAISSGIQNQLLEIGIPKDKIFLIYNPAQREQLVQENFDLDKKVKNLIYIGRIENKEKNIKLLLDSLNGFDFEWQLDIYGDGPDFQTMQDYAKQNVKNNQNIIWHGWNNNPWENIKQADLLLLTSNYKGFGMVLVEAIARGIPCLSSNCPVGPEDIIKVGVNGLLFKVGDKEDLVSKAEAFFKTQDNYKPKEIADSIEQFYEENYFKNLENVLENE